MILDAIKYLAGLNTPEPVKVGDYYFSHQDLKIVEIPKIETVKVTTLNGFIDFCNASKSKKDQFIHVGPDSARLMSKELSYSYRRECYCELVTETDHADVLREVKDKISKILIVS